MAQQNNLKPPQVESPTDLPAKVEPSESPSQVPPAAPSPGAELENAINKFQEHGDILTPFQLFKILASIRLRILVGLISLLITLTLAIFKLGQTFPDFPRSQSQPKESPLPPSEPEDNLYYDKAAYYPFQDAPPWLEAMSSNLQEDKTPSKDGTLETPSIIKIETKPFSKTTMPFTLNVTCSYGSNLWGYPFQVRSVPDGELYLPLKYSIDKSEFRVNVPRSEKGDSLLLVLRLNLDRANPSDLRDLFHLRRLK